MEYYLFIIMYSSVMYAKQSHHHMAQADPAANEIASSKCNSVVYCLLQCAISFSDTLHLPRSATGFMDVYLCSMSYMLTAVCLWPCLHLILKG